MHGLGNIVEIMDESRPAHRLEEACTASIRGTLIGDYINNFLKRDLTVVEKRRHSYYGLTGTFEYTGPGQMTGNDYENQTDRNQGFRLNKKQNTEIYIAFLNVLYDEKEQMREEVRTFIEKMLFGNAEFPYAGVLWFESGGRNYRLTRDLHRETPYSELLCETSGELIDADRISDLKGVRESVNPFLRMQSVLTHLKATPDQRSYVRRSSDRLRHSRP